MSPVDASGARELLPGQWRQLDEQSLTPAGEAAMEWARRAFPICRSITGDGVRQTLDMLRDRLPNLEIHEVPTGTPVLDWTVPDEWNLREAWIKGPDGKRVVDFADHNLHVLGYSEPVHRRLPLSELQDHLFSLPDQPDRIPYRTSYWRRHWAFCLTDRRRRSLADGDYEVFVDADLKPGHLTYGEVFLPGDSDREVLISAHTCHPSLANDNLSGIGVATEIFRFLARLPRRRLGYRLALVPGTIGAITWLARNRDRLDRVHGGLVAANLGDAGAFHFKRSRRGDTLLDRAVVKALEDSGVEHRVSDFVPFGYDERQYCSPGFDLPVGLLSRSPWGTFDEYHTSGDNLDFIDAGNLTQSIGRYLEVLRILEADRRFLSLNPHGEPQLGRRGLYNHIGGGEDGRERQLALLWVLNQSDGEHSLLDIARRAQMPFLAVADAAEALVKAELLRPLDVLSDGGASA